MKDTKKKTEAASAKNKNTKRDYGVKQEEFAAPAGFKKAATNDIFNFKKFGDTFAGKFKQMSTVGKGKKSSKVIECTDKNGAVVKCFASAHILKQFETNNIKAGMEVVIIFRDVAQLSGNRTLKLFDVYYK